MLWADILRTYAVTIIYLLRPLAEVAVVDHFPSGKHLQLTIGSLRK